MTEADWVQHWQVVLAGLYIISGSDRARPTADLLDALEARIGFALPLSYRAFLRVFGPGRFCEMFTVYSPGYPEAPLVDFLGNNNGWRNNPFRQQKGHAIPTALVGFGDYLGRRGLFAWNRDAVANREQREYEIIFVPEFPDEQSVTLSRSFADWVERDILGLGIWDKLGIEIDPAELAGEDDDTGEAYDHRNFWPIGAGPGMLDPAAGLSSPPPETC